MHHSSISERRRRDIFIGVVRSCDRADLNVQPAQTDFVFNEFWWQLTIRSFTENMINILYESSKGGVFYVIPYVFFYDSYCNQSTRLVSPKMTFNLQILSLEKISLHRLVELIDDMLLKNFPPGISI